jgi:hypothetical protein
MCTGDGAVSHQSANGRVAQLANPPCESHQARSFAQNRPGSKACQRAGGRRLRRAPGGPFSAAAKSVPRKPALPSSPRIREAAETPRRFALTVWPSHGRTQRAQRGLRASRFALRTQPKGNRAVTVILNRDRGPASPCWRARLRAGRARAQSARAFGRETTPTDGDALRVLFLLASIARRSIARARSALRAARAEAGPPETEACAQGDRTP